MADMDEFLCITEEDLKSEKELGNTIISIRGLDMIGESNTLCLTDIDLQKITKYVYNKKEDKSLCFYRNSIGEMNYTIGAHIAYPIGDVKYSQKIYYNKHMSYLGLNYIINKMISRYERSEKMRGFGLATHYTNNEEEIIQDYNNKLNTSRVLE
jgi:hypothetical protein